MVDYLRGCRLTRDLPDFTSMEERFSRIILRKCSVLFL